MMFKLLFLSVACIFIVQPVQCGIISKLSNIKIAAVGTVSDIASIVPTVIRAKGSAVLQAAAQTGNIIAVGAGLKAQALERLSTSITDSISEGLVSVGRRLSRQGTGLVEDKLENSNFAGMGVIPEDDMSGEIRRVGRRRLDTRPHYRIVYTPRVYRGPHGTSRSGLSKMKYKNKQ